MKRPKWTDEHTGIIFNADMVLKKAAKALRIDATDARKMGLKGVSGTLHYAAERLEKVADGATWADAFGWPESEKEGKK